MYERRITRSMDNNFHNSLDVAGHFLTVSEAASEVRNGRMVLIYDDKRKHEAVLCLAAQFARPEAVSFLQDATHDRIYVALSGERLERLQIVPSQASSTSRQEMTPTTSVDIHARTLNGITTHDYAS